MSKQYGRVKFPADAPVTPELRAKWDGKLVGNYSGTWASLAGRHEEGISLKCPDDCVAALTEAETKVAHLLEDTFWERTEYTEDVAVLEAVKSKMTPA